MEEVKKSMGPAEQEMFEKHDVVMARGKCGNKIPIVVPGDCKSAILLIEEARDRFVDKSNKYLFGNPLAHVTGHFCAGAVLKSVLTEIPLQQPELFLSTKLRKYCATTSQILEMGELDLEILTRHMGHDKAVHRAYYRKRRLMNSPERRC